MKDLTLALLLALLMSPVQFCWATPPPIVEYQFNEGSGSTAPNTGSLGPGTNGEVFGATYSLDTPSGTGYSLQFDGDDDFIRVQDTFDYTDRLTIQTWIKPYAVDGQRIIWDDYGNPGVDLFIQDGQLGFGLSTTANPGPGVAIYNGGSITVGEWQHVAVIYDGSQIKLYINGVHTGGVYNTSGAIIDNTGYDAAIGSDNQQTWLLNYIGMIDDFRIYNAALTPEELGYFPPLPKPVCIDIMPGKHHEYINFRTHREITVAILSTSEFYASDLVDKDSLTFGRTGDEDSLAFCYYRPEDINGDGLKDLICHFYAEDTGFQCGDKEGILKGTTKDGISIQGSDSVKIIPCKKPCKK